MKYMILICLSILLFLGCAKKEIIIKKNGFSIHEQKQDAAKAWRELDKE